MKEEKINKILEIINDDNTMFIEIVSPYIVYNKKKVLANLSAENINKIYSSLSTSQKPPKSSPQPHQTKPEVKKTKTTRKKHIDKVKDKVRFNDGDQFILNRKTFKIKKYLTEREDSIMYIGEWLEAPNADNRDVFIKIQPRDKKTVFQITTESHTMTQLSKAGCDTLSQRSIAYGSYNDDRYILVSTLHGNDLKMLKDTKNIQEIKRVSLLAIDAIESIHKCGYIHRDIKHENMVYEKQGSTSGNIIIIDHGLTESIYDRNGIRKIKKIAPEGSPFFMSINQHKGMAPDYSHDLEAIAYMVLDLLGKLPWNSESGDICKAKEAFLKDYIDGKLSGNMKHMGELVRYTHKDNINDYMEYDPNHYKDVKKILNKLS